MLSVTVEDLGEVVILHCLGRIVRGDETVLLCTAVHSRGRDIILDLAEVEAIDAAGAGALISLQAAGVYLRLANPRKQVREVLRLTGLESIFEISEAPAIAGDSRARAGQLNASTSCLPEPEPRKLEFGRSLY